MKSNKLLQEQQQETEQIPQEIVGEIFKVWNENLNVSLSTGTVAEELNPGDIIRLNENGEWVKVSVPEQ